MAPLAAPPDTSVKATLLDKLATSHAVTAVIGLGYVGLPLAVCMARVGFRVLGYDVQQSRVDRINAGNSYIDDVTSDELKPFTGQGLPEQHSGNGLIDATTDVSRLADADVIVICVPTPLTVNRDPDISYIQASCEQIANILRPGQLITLESTTYPGTTEEIMVPILEKAASQRGLELDKDYFVAFSPERVDPGNARYTTQNTNKVVGGVTPDCLEVAQAFYGRFIVQTIPVSTPATAEMVKVFENTFRAVNIALVNELAVLCDRMGLNVWEVVEAAATKPFGLMRFDPGPGVGGHCIPIDPFYLTWKAREYNIHTRFIELAGEINAFMPAFVREKLIRALGKLGKPLYGSRLLILGMAYKGNLADWRHSPAVDLLRLLQDDQVNWVYHDPFVPEIKDTQLGQHTSQALTPDVLNDIDAAILLTNHQGVDLETVLRHVPVLVDTRNATKTITEPGLRDKIVLL